MDGSWGHLEPDAPTGDDDWDIDTWQLQVGFDRPVHESDDGLLVGGITFNYGEADTDVSSFYGDGSVATEAYGFGGSLTWFGYNDVYVDGQAQLNWFESDLHSGLFGEDMTSGNDGFGYAFGVEAGKRIDLNDDWTMTPQGQVVYSSVDFDDFVDPFGAEVSQQDGESLPLRLGLSVDQENAWLDDSQGEVRTHFYGIGNLVYEALGDTGVDVSGSGVSVENDDRLGGSLGVGGTYSWDGGTKAIYGEGLVATSLSNFADNYTNRATFGFRAIW
jgi:fibronectin-binding autotransporter adhesin